MGRRMCPFIFWTEQDQLSFIQRSVSPRVSKGNSIEQPVLGLFCSRYSLVCCLLTINLSSIKSIQEYGWNRVNSTSKGRSQFQETTQPSAMPGRELVGQWALCCIPAPGVGLQVAAGWAYLGAGFTVPSKCQCEKQSKLWTIVEILSELKCQLLWSKISMDWNNALENGMVPLIVDTAFKSGDVCELHEIHWW